MPPSRPAPRSSPWSGLRHRDPSPRDRRLDWLRGCAVLAMSINHFGLDRSWYHPVTGGSVFLINAAEVFFFVSGVTLGIVSGRRDLAAGSIRCWRRVVDLWLAIMLMAFGGAALGHEAIDRDEPLRWIGSVLTLQEAPFWSDVLVTYVLYLLAVPPILALLHAGRTRLVVAGIVAVYVAGRLDPGRLELPFAGFRTLSVNAPLFLGGVVLGWHREAVASAWSRMPGRRIVDGLAVAAGLGLLVLYATGYRGWPALGEALEVSTLEQREFHMPPLALAIVVVYLRCLWLLVDRLWLVLARGLGWLVEPLGRAALAAYVAHAFLMPVTWWIVERIPVDLDPETGTGATAITTLYAGLLFATAWAVHGLARVRVGTRVDPAAPHGRRGRPLTRVLGPFATAASGVAVLALAFLGRGVDPAADPPEKDLPVAWAHEAVYGRLADLDAHRAAVVVHPLPRGPGEPDHDPGELAARIRDTVAEELGEAVSSIRLELHRVDDGGPDDPFGPELVRRLAEDESLRVGPEGLPVIVVVARAASADPAAPAGAIHRAIVGARASAPDALAIVALALSPSRPEDAWQEPPE